MSTKPKTKTTKELTAELAELAEAQRKFAEKTERDSLVTRAMIANVSNQAANLKLSLDNNIDVAIGGLEHASEARAALKQEVAKVANDLAVSCKAYDYCFDRLNVRLRPLEHPPVPPKESFFAPILARIRRLW